jgi:hypothetical protein
MGKVDTETENSRHVDMQAIGLQQKILLRRPQARNSSVGRASTANGLDVVVVLVADFQFRLGRAR